MAKEKVLKFRRVAERIRSEREELQNTIPGPFIVAMKGDPATGRKLAAFLAASILKCPLIKEHDFDIYEEKMEENSGKVWRKICKLASTQLKSGHSVVIDTELANESEFNLLKGFSEMNQTPLAVIECRVIDADEIWRNINEIWRNITEEIAFEFLEKPTSHNINPTSYNMGEILKIPMEIHYRCAFLNSVSSALEDLRDYINPSFASKETNDCDHVFQLNRDDEYRRRCSKCKQLVSGSYYHCEDCRFIAHKTCCFFPESFYVYNKSPWGRVMLNLRRAVPKLDADVTCSCCMQLLTGQYYCSDDGLILDLDCLFSLPSKHTTKLHKHELRLSFGGAQRPCDGCDAIIGADNIYYYCMTCSSSFDVYCLALPETVDFDRHRHPFKLSVVPRVDSLPYYCEVCQNERNTECWIYYCEECDYPIHPRCIVEAPSLLKSLSTQISISNKNTKEVLTGTEFQGCSSHMSSERVLMEKLPREHRSEAKELRLLFKQSLKEIELPILIMTMGHSDTGRILVASILATTLDCLLIDEDNLCEVTNIANESKQVCYQEFSRVARSQLQIGLSVVIDSDLSHESEFLFLRDLAIATATPLFIVECKLCDEDIPEDFHNISNLCSDNEFNVCDIPKLVVNVTTPTFDGIKELMPHILRSISSYIKQWSKRHSTEPEIPYCYKHTIALGLDHDVSEGEICSRCSQQLSTPILKCSDCALVLHKECTELPWRMCVQHCNFLLKKYADTNDKLKCDCCKEFVKDHAYTSADMMMCLDCLFTPWEPRVNLHGHPMVLRLGREFKCDACGSYFKQTLLYACKLFDCDHSIGSKCGLLEKTVPFDRHRHPFHLIVSPKHVSNQYYCEVCGEERDKDHWVYGCIECDYFIHVRCGADRRLPSSRVVTQLIARMQTCFARRVCFLFSSEKRICFFVKLVNLMRVPRIQIYYGLNVHFSARLHMTQ